jgi:ABC-2 type transport system permease protein
MLNLLHSEFVKINGTRILAAPLTFSLAIVFLIILSNHAVPHDQASAHSILTTVSEGVPFAIVAGILGMAGEERYGGMALSLIVTPRRLRLLMAKIISYAIVGLVYGVCTSVIAFLAALLIFGGEIPMSAAGIISILGPSLIAYVLLSVLGVGIAAAWQHAIPLTILTLVWMYLAEDLIDIAVPGLSYIFPDGAARSLADVSAGPIAGKPSVAEGVAALLVYAIVAAVIGGFAFVRRDVQ